MVIEHIFNGKSLSKMEVYSWENHRTKKHLGDRMGTVAIMLIRWNINPISIVSPSDYLLLIVVRYSMIVHYTNISGTEPQTPMVYD